MIKVNVLLSIHNPEKEWLDSQIRSLWDQTDVEVALQIRNDGTSEFQTNMNGHVRKFDADGHLGVGISYLELLSQCDSGGFSFCDQDDIWLNHKLSAQIEALTDFNSPAMAYCDFQIINSVGRKIGHRKSRNKVSKFSLLFRNNIPGFSMYFNDEARSLLKNSKEYLPADAYHDWWSAVVISQLGRCLRVSEELVKYRIHDKNTVGISRNLLTRIRNLLIKMEFGPHENEKSLLQVSRFIEFHSPTHESIIFLREISNGMRLSRLSRLQILIKHGILRTSLSDLANSVLLYVFPSRLKV